jgi:hypothetical protein
MIIGPNYLFIAIPKVASGAIEAALNKHPIKAQHDPYRGMYLKRLGDFGNSHVTLEMAHSAFPETKPLISFAFSRNPYDRFISFCASTWISFASINDGPITFKKEPHRFMNLMLDYADTTGKWTTQIWPQSRFVKSGDDDLSFIGEYETLQQSFDFICDLIKLPHTKLELHNASERSKDFRSYYTTSLVDRVTDYYKDDLNMFGYKFE